MSDGWDSAVVAASRRARIGASRSLRARLTKLTDDYSEHYNYVVLILILFLEIGCESFEIANLLVYGPAQSRTQKW